MYMCIYHISLVQYIVFSYFRKTRVVSYITTVLLSKPRIWYRHCFLICSPHSNLSVVSITFFIPTDRLSFSSNFFFSVNCRFACSCKKYTERCRCPHYLVSPSDNMLQNYSITSQPGNWQWFCQDTEHFRHHKDPL